MKILSYVKLTPAQEKTIDDFEKVIVRRAPASTNATPAVIATIRTSLAQTIRITIAGDGGIEDAEVSHDSL